jgi:GAF domain-containing protein
MSLKKIEILTKKLEKAESLIASISKVQDMYIQNKSREEIFENLLMILLGVSDSEYGFIGQVLFRDNSPYLKTYAITDISWDEGTRKFFKENAPQGLEFTNLKSLFGETLITGEAVITNDPKNHPKSGGLPKGHPPLKAYMGIPFHNNGKLIGMCGVANKNGGYDVELLKSLEVLVTLISHLIQAHIENKKGF